MSRAQILEQPAAALPEAAQFLAGYFHQDWVLERRSWEQVVDEYAADSPGAVAAECAAQLRALADAGLQGNELSSALEEIGCSVDPSAYGLTVDAWLRAVAEQLQRVVEG